MLNKTAKDFLAVLIFLIVFILFIIFGVFYFTLETDEIDESSGCEKSGPDAYSVIELKMIEQILSETADDRKRMFEEAAGINKYKQQRQSALRKFDAIQRDLDRINDIVQEVEQQVHSLGLQLKRFIRHEKLSTSLFEKELALAYIKIHNYDSELIPLRKNVSESLALKNEKSSDTSLLEKELEEIKKNKNDISYFFTRLFQKVSAFFPN